MKVLRLHFAIGLNREDMRRLSRAAGGVGNATLRSYVGRPRVMEFFNSQ